MPGLRHVRPSHFRGLPLAVCLLLLGAMSSCTCVDPVETEPWEFREPHPDGYVPDMGPDGVSYPDIGCDYVRPGECDPCLTRIGGNPGWERHKGRGAFCWGGAYDTHGDRREYDHARIPDETDSGWRLAGLDISFEGESKLCDKRNCQCLDGGDFTYYQTFFGVPEGFDVDSLEVEIDNVDDGARITVFNDRYPEGATPRGSYAFLGGGSTTNLAKYLDAGTNRIVITHVDDCCQTRRIAGVDVRLNDDKLDWCR